MGLEHVYLSSSDAVGAAAKVQVTDPLVAAQKVANELYSPDGENYYNISSTIATSTYEPSNPLLSTSGWSSSLYDYKTNFLTANDFVLAPWSLQMYALFPLKILTIDWSQ